jgi:hypothetical protein
MDRWSRNERLYQNLLSMGLVVDPIYEDGDPAKINYLVVSVDLPKTHQAAEDPATAGVGGAMKRPQVAEVVGAAKGSGDGVVIDLPSKR